MSVSVGTGSAAGAVMDLRPLEPGDSHPSHRAVPELMLLHRVFGMDSGGIFVFSMAWALPSCAPAGGPRREHPLLTLCQPFCR